MALIVVAADKGAPGVTTASVALAAVWPRPVLLAECDPAGGDIVYRLPAPDGGRLDPRRGLLSLAVAARRGLEPGQVWEHTQKLRGGLDVLVGMTNAEQGAGLDPLWGQVGAALSALPHADVIADCGRIGPEGRHYDLLARADVVVLIARASLGDMVRLRDRVSVVEAALRRRAGTASRIGIVVIADYKHFSAALAEVRQVLGRAESPVSVLGGFAFEPKSAELLSGEWGGKLDKSLLIRTAREIAAGLAAHLPAPQQRGAQELGAPPPAAQLPAPPPSAAAPGGAPSGPQRRRGGGNGGLEHIARGAPDAAVPGAQPPGFRQPGPPQPASGPSGSARSAPLRSGPAQAGPAQAGPAQAGPAQTGPGPADHPRPDLRQRDHQVPGPATPVAEGPAAGRSLTSPTTPAGIAGLEPPAYPGAPARSEGRSTDASAVPPAHDWGHAPPAWAAAPPAASSPGRAARHYDDLAGQPTPPADGRAQHWPPAAASSRHPGDPAVRGHGDLAGQQAPLADSQAHYAAPAGAAPEPAAQQHVRREQLAQDPPAPRHVLPDPSSPDAGPPHAGWPIPEPAATEPAATEPPLAALPPLPPAAAPAPLPAGPGPAADRTTLPPLPSAAAPAPWPTGPGPSAGGATLSSLPAASEPGAPAPRAAPADRDGVSASPGNSAPPASAALADPAASRGASVWGPPAASQDRASPTPPQPSHPSQDRDAAQPATDHAAARNRASQAAQHADLLRAQEPATQAVPQEDLSQRQGRSRQASRDQEPLSSQQPASEQPASQQSASSETASPPPLRQVPGNQTYRSAVYPPIADETPEPGRAGRAGRNQPAPGSGLLGPANDSPDWQRSGPPSVLDNARSQPQGGTGSAAVRPAHQPSADQSRPHQPPVLQGAVLPPVTPPDLWEQPGQQQPGQQPSGHQEQSNWWTAPDPWAPAEPSAQSQAPGPAGPARPAAGWPASSGWEAPDHGRHAGSLDGTGGSAADQGGR